VNLAEIPSCAESCHTKGQFTASGEMDKASHVQCLNLAQDAGVPSGVALICDGRQDKGWEGPAHQALTLHSEVSATAFLDVIVRREESHILNRGETWGWSTGKCTAAVDDLDTLDAQSHELK